MTKIGNSERIILSLIETTRRLIEDAPDYKKATVQERQKLFTETFTSLKTAILSDDLAHYEKVETWLKELREAN